MAEIDLRGGPEPPPSDAEAVPAATPAGLAISPTSATATEVGERPGEQPTFDERPLPELFGRLTSDLGDLLSNHVHLAAAELRQEARDAARAAAMAVVGAVAALFALLLLSFAAAWGLAEVMAPGLAFLIVGVVYGVAAAAFLLVARGRAEQIQPVPPETTQTIQEDVQWLRTRNS
ncbi:MAG: phage holin family protein [Acidimicrobiales bacterium]